uniref:Uncharacterized protein n=1 Tax=mine drainage metagenome TaxID=410659 RepID=E6QMW9_9ZZZZ
MRGALVTGPFQYHRSAALERPAAFPDSLIAQNPNMRFKPSAFPRVIATANATESMWVEP